MQPTRQIGIPLDHVIAELAAFPLAGEAALQLAITALDARLQGKTGTLWRAAEHSAVGHFPGFSVDEVVAIRDRSWFGSKRGEVPLQPLHRYLAGLARCGRGPHVIRIAQRDYYDEKVLEEYRRENMATQ